MRRILGWLAVVLVMALGVTPAGAAPLHLDYGGQTVTRRQAEALLAPAARAPRDSVALVAALGRLVAALQNVGHLDARASGEWDSIGGEARLAVRVEEGPRYRVTSLALTAAAGAESSFFADHLPVKAGAWAAPGELARTLDGAVRAAAGAGHPYARLEVTQFEWDSSGARVRLSGSLGPAVEVSAVRFEGMRVTRPAIAERALGRLAGRRFDPVAAEAGRDRLLRLGLFRGVEYRGLEGEGDWSRARLVYRVEEPSYNRFEGALGVQGERRPAGLLRLDLGNLAGTGRALALSWESRGEPAEALAARYVEPLVFGTALRAEVLLDHQREDSLFTRARWATRLSFPLAGHGHLEAGYEQDRVLDRAADVEEADVQSTLFALERDGRDLLPTPRRGTRVRVEALQSFKREDLRPSGTRKSTSSGADGTLEWHQPVRAAAGIAWTLRTAGRFGSQPVLGVYERYPLGGAATLRGFDEQALRVDRFGLSRLEWRWFAGSGGQHLALFWDHAWTFTRVAESSGTRVEERHRDGVGAGLRVHGPAGQIGVDYGLEPGRPPVEGKLHLQLVTRF